MANNNYLYNQLVEINKKYESTSFVDIDIVDLFNIRLIEISNAKKLITNKYYSLALIYHPDKYLNQNNNIQISNITIDIDEILTGQFLSFITDIYKILINMLKEDKDNLIRIINGGDIIELNFGGDHSNLKQHFNNKQIQVNTNEINDLKNVIIDSKIDINELETMINNAESTRKEIQIENIFVNDDIMGVEFKNKFNNKFVDSIKTDNDVQKEIVPFNVLNTSQKLISNRQTTSISDITEAFEIINVNRKIHNQLLSYEDLLIKRENETNSFKVAKNFKRIESDFIID